MARQLVFRAAVGGKHPVNKHPVSRTDRVSKLFADTRRLTLAAAVFFMTSLAASTGHAQSGPFAGMAGTWNGSGTITLDDGSKERIRCRATYQVGGPKMTMALTCASDAYKFALEANVVDQGGVVSGNWTETSRNVSGNLQGRGGGGNFQVVAEAPGFNANISLRTAGNKQSVSISSDSQFRAANITLSK
jgi:hypothetical protein